MFTKLNLTFCLEETSNSSSENESSIDEGFAKSVHDITHGETN